MKHQGGRDLARLAKHSLTLLFVSLFHAVFASLVCAFLHQKIDNATERLNGVPNLIRGSLSASVTNRLTAAPCKLLAELSRYQYVFLRRE